MILIITSEVKIEFKKGSTDKQKYANLLPDCSINSDENYDLIMKLEIYRVFTSFWIKRKVSKILENSQVVLLSCIFIVIYIKLSQCLSLAPS